MSSRSGVEAVREGSRVVLRPHHGHQPQLHAGLPVSTRDRPTGRRDDAPMANKHKCTQIRRLCDRRSLISGRRVRAGFRLPL